MDWKPLDRTSEAAEAFDLLRELTQMANQLTQAIASLCLPRPDFHGAHGLPRRDLVCVTDVNVIHSVLQMVRMAIYPNWSWRDLRSRRQLANMVRAYVRLAQALQRMRKAELAAERREEFVHLASRLTAVAHPLTRFLCSPPKGELSEFRPVARQVRPECSAEAVASTVANGIPALRAILPAPSSEWPCLPRDSV